ncbi:MAG: hypothetical protein H7Y03_14050 [Chitinophagaceae bacterium]|nr:hypothetical protein [Chitinophagaceae bacterium]
MKKINILSFKEGLICLIFSVGIVSASYAGVSYGEGGGGGGDKPKTSLAASFALSRLKPNNGFTLKAGPSYRSGSIFNEPKTAGFLTVHSVVTYQKGNATYILPYKHKVSVAAAKSNLQAVNVKVTIRR